MELLAHSFLMPQTTSETTLDNSPQAHTSYLELPSLDSTWLLDKPETSEDYSQSHTDTSSTVPTLPQHHLTSQLISKLSSPTLDSLDKMPQTEDPSKLQLLPKTSNSQDKPNQVKLTLSSCHHHASSSTNWTSLDSFLKVLSTDIKTLLQLVNLFSSLTHSCQVKLRLFKFHSFKDSLEPVLLETPMLTKHTETSKSTLALD